MLKEFVLFSVYMIKLKWRIDMGAEFTLTNIWQNNRDCGEMYYQLEDV